LAPAVDGASAAAALFDPASSFRKRPVAAPPAHRARPAASHLAHKPPPRKPLARPQGAAPGTPPVRQSPTHTASEQDWEEF
ncbi:MAG: hypothetical protein RSF79_22305, partial [Janthinobacterium sp.]